MLFLVFSFSLLAIGLAEKPYAGYTVFEIIPNSGLQLNFLRKFATEDDQLDWVMEPTVVGERALVMVGPDDVVGLKMALAPEGMHAAVYIEDVQKLVDEEKARLQARYAKAGSTFAFDVDDWNTYEDIMTQIDEWVKACPEGLRCLAREIGSTYEGRVLKLLEINSGNKDKPVVWLDATTHAREWLSTGTILKLTDNFIKNYGSDASVTSFLDSYDLYILPVVNPDGYVKAWDNNRLWRKNNAPTNLGLCPGVDLNRNFDWNWCTEGASSLPCSDTYCGPSANSELEIQAVTKEGLQVAQSRNILTWVSFHTFGKYMLFPWGNTVNGAGWFCERSDDYDDLLRAADAFADTVEEVGGQRWQRGTACQVLYSATGSTMDWAKGFAGVKYTYTPELRGLFFIVDKSTIQTSFTEVWAGLQSMVREIEVIEASKV